MRLFLRKSFKFGPLRLNLSKASRSRKKRWGYAGLSTAKGGGSKGSRREPLPNSGKLVIRFLIAFIIAFGVIVAIVKVLG